MAETGKKSRKSLIIVLLVVLLGVVGGGWWLYNNSLYVSTDDARIDGTMVTVSSKVPGRLLSVNIKEGDIIKTGQLIASIDTEDLLVQKKQMLANLESLRAKYTEALNGSRTEDIRGAKASADAYAAQLDYAEKSLARSQRLYSEGAISIDKLDAEKAAVNALKANLQAAHEKYNLVVAGVRVETIDSLAAQVKQAEAAVESLDVNLKNANILSPVDGVLVLKAVSNGELVAVGQPICTIADMKDVWVNANIEETKINRIAVGSKVEYTIDGYPGKKFTGEVYEINSATKSTFALIPADNASGNFTKVTQRIPIKISLPQDSDFVFRPGMSAIVRIGRK